MTTATRAARPKQHDETWEQWVAEGRALRSQRDRTQWAIGDLALQVETRYGEKSLSGFADEIGTGHSTIREQRHVARVFENDARASDLSWTHHRILAHEPLTPAEQQQWLRLALRHGWSSRQLDAAIVRFWSSGGGKGKGQRKRTRSQSRDPEKETRLDQAYSAALAAVSALREELEGVRMSDRRRVLAGIRTYLSGMLEMTPEEVEVPETEGERLLSYSPQQPVATATARTEALPEMDRLFEESDEDREKRRKT